MEVTHFREITFCVEYVNLITFAKFRGGQLPSLPVPGCLTVCNPMVLSSTQLQKVSVTLLFNRLLCLVTLSVLAVATDTPVHLQI